ncbi:2-desacetyl-2-hydroxyethyl bacteriochlorophyllide A dehydrogenase [Paenibacillus algorifonticola]|uniref:2-desacetyl-2-hydroxyethyl bacteriochlorophyllide A dehydrogenase n=1 Tax=Paenibacillus algorifonticola TaxID=684063 RepID=A0A1I2I5Z8_9BACL|nr:zinc-binding alcohol dehydrogenase family protein [Paenibacillus algorifonticola]SFF37722.1 2-desacetyl-2-hydroxyethyl bacteriochlorophyllide A dehydrogenase [Paenibacillus algorifonticola]
MKTIICTKPEQFDLIDTEMPVRGQGEALLKVHYIGVCGTDYHAYRGKQPYFEYPRILGHEIAAEVVEIENNAYGIKAGDNVTVIPYLFNENSIASRRGKPNACNELKVIGCHVDGAMREYISVPIHHLKKADGLTLEQTVIIEPMSIGLHGVNRAGVKADEWVLVLGAGPIGLAVMKFAKLAGAKVIALDINAERLAFCRKWAEVDHVVKAGDDVVQELERITGGDLPTSVIDATGNAQSMMNAFKYAAHGGNVVFVSLVQGDITFNDPDFHKKELTLLGSRAATSEEFDYVIDCLRQNKLDADSFITHQADFDQAIASFNHWLDPSSGVIKAIIKV